MTKLALINLRAALQGWDARTVNTVHDEIVVEARIDQAARQKIENQKRTILEGSQEWEILYRKYYNEEVKKLGL